jgi:hypothetical protein
MTFDPNLTQRLKVAVRRRVVPNWRSRLTDYSTLALASLTGLVGIWVLIPDDIKVTFAPWVAVWFGRLLLGLGAWGTVGKFLNQPGKQP